MTLPKDELRELTNEALDAFWGAIVKRYPQATTGDLSPWPTMKLRMAAEDAIEEWIENNVFSAARVHAEAEVEEEDEKVL
jgi:hypothetical protein